MPPRQFVFRQVDVFTYAPHLGNPLAVVPDDEGLDEDAMLHCANRTTLAKTTFRPPGHRAGSGPPHADLHHHHGTTLCRTSHPGHDRPMPGSTPERDARAYLRAEERVLYQSVREIVAHELVATPRLDHECLLGLVEQLEQTADPLEAALPSRALVALFALHMGTEDTINLPANTANMLTSPANDG